jgi:(heptosyl)LPS beta-1,4-glucosyltransferase
MKISAKVNVFNEEENIAGLCETVDWADEIVVVDSDSTDRTVEIARKYTDKIFNIPFEGYKQKHEFSDSKTSGDWIFWIDADERLNPQLRESILSLKERDPASLPDGFRIARKAYYLGRWIKHSGWYPDYVMRLYRKEGSYWDGVAPHQIAHVKGRVETLDGELLHYTKQGVGEHHFVTERYARLAAEDLFKNGRRAGWSDIAFRPFLAFIRTYLFKAGFLDGIPGLIIAYFTAYGVFLKYSMLWELNRPAGEDSGE